MKQFFKNLRLYRAYTKLKKELEKRMVVVKETMSLQHAAEVYARYVCRMNGWSVEIGSGYSYMFVDTELAFINGYRKALADNGFDFKNGLVCKRDITEDMPSGALNHFRKDIVEETLKEDSETLVKVLKRFKMPDSNINTIVEAFIEAQHDDS